MANREGNSGKSSSLYFLGFKITADGDFSHEIKRCLLLGRKVMTNLDSRDLKSRDITLSTKVRLVQAMVFSAVMYGCESWTIKIAEWGRIDALELWNWRRLLRVPWTARRSNQSILKEISPGCSLEGLMLKLKLQYFGHLMWRADSFEKTLMLGGIGGKRKRGQQDEMVGWHHQLNVHVWVNSGIFWRDRKAWHVAVHGITKSRRGLSNWWTELNNITTGCLMTFSFPLQNKVTQAWLSPTLNLSTQGNPGRHISLLDWMRFPPITSGSPIASVRETNQESTFKMAK